jgi:2Fe-2S ferredoxin
MNQLTGTAFAHSSGRPDFRRCFVAFATKLTRFKEKNMPLITIQPSGKTIEAAPGSTLLSALLAAGEKIVAKCGGNAQCGNCHVFVNEGRKSLSKTQKAEHEKLDTIVGVGSKSRLACQALVGEEDVTVEVLSFV